MINFWCCVVHLFGGCWHHTGPRWYLCWGSAWTPSSCVFSLRHTYYFWIVHPKVHYPDNYIFRYYKHTGFSSEKRSPRSRGLMVCIALSCEDICSWHSKSGTWFMESEVTSVWEVGERGSLVENICFQTHIDPWLHDMGWGVTSEGGMNWAMLQVTPGKEVWSRLWSHPCKPGCWNSSW